MEVLPENSATQEPGRQVRQDHEHRVEEHLDPELTRCKANSIFLYENDTSDGF